MNVAQLTISIYPFEGSKPNPFVKLESVCEKPL